MVPRDGDKWAHVDRRETRMKGPILALDTHRENQWEGALVTG